MPPSQALQPAMEGPLSPKSPKSERPSQLTTLAAERRHGTVIGSEGWAETDRHPIQLYQVTSSDCLGYQAFVP